MFHVYECRMCSAQALLIIHLLTHSHNLAVTMHCLRWLGCGLLAGWQGWLSQEIYKQRKSVMTWQQDSLMDQSEADIS